jgi:hypothetical protein
MFRVLSHTIGVWFEFDASLGNVKKEFSVRAIVIFPAIMRLFEVVVAKCLDSLLEDLFRDDRFGIAPCGLLDGDGHGGQFNHLVASVSGDALDLVAVAPTPSNSTSTWVMFAAASASKTALLLPALRLAGALRVRQKRRTGPRR